MEKKEKKKVPHVPGLKFESEKIILRKSAPKKQPVSSASGPSVVIDEATGDMKVRRFDPALVQSLKKERERKKMTQKDLAMKISKPLSTIIAFENETALYDESLLSKIKKALGLEEPKKKNEV
jgi:ribosome-binding protein aMBF1 (putative translation factor)